MQVRRLGMVTWFPMGLGLPTCTAACCLPDGFSFGGKSQDDAFHGGMRSGRMSHTMKASPLNFHDEVELHDDNKQNMIVFRNDRAPEPAIRHGVAGGWREAEPATGTNPDSSFKRAKTEMPTISAAGEDRRSQTEASYEFAADSCSMLNDLDFLTDPEWQTMPQPSRSALEEGLIKEAETVLPEKAYAVALKSLWHNCPDALEVALQRVEDLPLSEAQARDKRFMAQKLEFTRIRQRFVAYCIEFRSSGPATEASEVTLRTGIAGLEEMLELLMAEQPDEQLTQLPGLIGKRDTIMLQARIRTIIKKLLTGED